ncbi:MAG: HAD-IA family hydrolase [Lachnospiraceae bacterium]|nr:HAD-IA family hydrolase [Lachnospiraceae bacterium]
MSKTIIFDLDGTLTDSGEGIIKSVLYAYEQLGIAAPGEEELRTFVGPPLDVSFRNHGVPDERNSEAIAFYRKVYNEGPYKFANRVYDGMEEVLQNLQEEGYRLCVGTSKPEFLAKEILEHFHLAKYFTFIAGATLDVGRITKSEVIAYLLEEIDGGDCLMIGDTIYDVEGTKQFQIPCIGVDWGYGKLEDMKKAGAVAVVSDMEELQRAIHRQLSL